MDKIQITLIENGEHSLRKGIEAYKLFQKKRGETSKKKMLLKEALMFIHQGVELLLKEILVRKSEFLIFSDLKLATKKQLQADREGKGIFYLDNPPHTVTYSEAIDRVCAFIEKLDVEFQNSLNELNNFRNQIEHYQIDVTKDEIENIIEKVLPPLETLLEEKLSIQLSPDLEKEIKVIQDLSTKRHQFYSDAEKQFSELIPLLSGNELNKNLMFSEQDVRIPEFKEILKEPREYSKSRNLRYIPDFLIKTKKEDWIVEIKGNQFAEHTFYNLFDFADKLDDKPQLWLVTIGEIKSKTLKQRLKEKGIYVSNLLELIEGVKKKAKS